MTRLEPLPRSVLKALAANGSALTARQLDELGFNPNDRAWAMRHGLLRRVSRGRYALPLDTHEDQWSEARERHLLHLAAALATAPDAAAALRSAALVWGLPVSSIPAKPEILRAANRARLSHVRTIRTERFPSVLTRGGLRVTSMETTALDLSFDLPVPESLITMDAALRAGADPESMAAELSARGAVRGCRQARNALRWGDKRAESPLESRGRGELLLRGIPIPECNVVLSLDGYECRVDTLWEGLGIAGEADGKGKYRGSTNRNSLWHEKIRQEWLENVLGLEVLRWNDGELRNDPAGLASRWHRLARRRRTDPWRPPPDLLFAERSVRSNPRAF